jgi:L-ribulokinase
LSVRVTLLDSERGRLGTASASYALHRKREDPDYATQSHDEQMSSLAKAVRDVMQQTGVKPDEVVALSLDTTGSSVIFVDKQLKPLDEYMLWCDHRAHKEAQEITELGRAVGLEAIEWCGGVY